MFTRNTLAKLLVVSASVLLTLVLAGGGVLAAAQCKKINGKLTLQSLPSNPCGSAVGVCASGTFSGDLAGTFTFAGSQFITSTDTQTTSVALLTGNNMITTAHGTLMTKDAIVLETVGNGDFAEVDTIVGGTGEWAGATGSIRAQGVFTAASGGEGDYVGDICIP
jgi:hypothetical protein